jgi:hypothetical protein
MPLDPRELFEFLEEVERSLETPIELVAVGGTALTLLGVKPSTIDVDFTGPKKSISAFRTALAITPHGFKVDLWTDGQVFSQFLPGDYLRKSRPIKRIGTISLRALSPVDIVVTKAGRLDERDEQDIRDCAKRFKITKAAVSARAAQVEVAGREETYRERVAYVVNVVLSK